jgi:hypothetical protein
MDCAHKAGNLTLSSLVQASLVDTIKLFMQAVLKINFILLFLIYHDEMRRPFSAAEAALSCQLNINRVLI